MKTFAKIFVSLLFIAIFSLTAPAQNFAWVGSYTFDENGGTSIFISHQLEIRATDGGLMATLQSNGYQTSKDLLATAKPVGEKLFLYFESYGEYNVFETFGPGDLLLTLERKTVKDKTEFITHWNKFLPVVPKNEKPGKVYFKKTDD